ncbi:hypothetical protein A3731_06580 [Roseovarius sp. HI0049]|nr:hypothetical protein A3731_35865 [Roseovarius sp. HI0049]KZY48557.1 hypothetical protein A3731_06580 [Roseovarius sp. HI0049]
MAFLSASRSRACPQIRRRASLLDLLGLSRQRRKLAQLDEAALRDIGITRRQALEEARRPAWDVPRHWVR